MSDTLAAFPVDDVTLSLVEHALAAVYEVDEDGTHRVTGADMNLPQLLDFLSGYDESKTRQAVNGDVFEYPDPIYSPTDVIAALIAEVRRLREEPA